MKKSTLFVRCWAAASAAALAIAACGGSSQTDDTSTKAGASNAGNSSAGSATAGSQSAGGSSSSGGGGSKSTGGSSSPGGTANGGASAGAGLGGASHVPCGGQVCRTDQICCGPAECGHCISQSSGQVCPDMCPGGGGAGGSGNCSQLLDQLDKTKATAQACNPTAAKPTQECAGSLEGPCCPIGVELASPTAPANAAYLSALDAYKAANCLQACPAVLCLKPQPGNCSPSGPTTGQCIP